MPLSRTQWLGFFALCLLSASAWLVDGAWPSSLPAAPRQSLHDLLIAAAFAAILGIPGRKRPNLRSRPWARLALASILLLGVPATLAQFTLGGVSEVTIAVLFTMIPVAVVVIVSCADSARAESSGATTPLLAPALAGLGGALLLLPFTTPTSWHTFGLVAIVLLAVLIAAAACVWLYRLLRSFTTVEAAAICSLANALFFLAVFLVSNVTTNVEVLSALSRQTLVLEIATALLFDLPQILLLLWLMRDLTPERFAARFLVIPLLTVFEGFALLHPEPTPRDIFGALLMIFATWRLMTTPPTP
jgi:hypothetical protein